MSRNLIHLFSLRVILVTLTAAIILGCSEDKPNEPENNTNEENIVASATIGSEGGTIAGDEIRIDIPPGAFSETQNLSIHLIDTIVFKHGVVTGIFRLEGLPDNFSKPLQFALSHNGNLNEVSYLVYKEEIYDSFVEELVEIYNSVSAADSSGYLVAKINPRQDELPLNKTVSGLGLTVGDLLGISWEKGIGAAGPHFNVAYAPGLNKAVSETRIAGLWEDYYIFLRKSLGLKFSETGDEHWGVIVNYFNSFAQKDLYITDFYGVFMMNNELLEKQGLVNDFDFFVFNHLFIQSVTYYSQNETSVHWLSTSIQVWLNYLRKFDEVFPEHKFFNVPNPLSPLNGLNVQPSSETELENIGISMYVLIKFLFEYEFNSKTLLETEDIGKIFDLSKNGVNPMVALFETINEPESEWWPEFFKHYIAGEINNVNSDDFIDSKNADHYWKIQSSIGNDSFLILESFPDLSAKSFVIDIGEINLQPSSKFSLTLNNFSEEKINGLTTLVFALNNDSLDLIRTGRDIKINNLKADYFDKGITKFLAVVVNSNGDESLSEPFTGTTSANVELRYDEEESVFKECYIDFDIASAYYDRTYNDGTSDQVLGLGDFSDYFDLTLNGTKYSGNLSEKYQFGSDSTFTNYNLEFELNDQKNKITNLTIEIESNTRSIYSNTDDPREGTYRIIKFKDIPLLSGFNDRFEIRGKEACNYIDSFIGNAFYVTYYQQVLSMWECNDESRIYIDLD